MEYFINGYCRVLDNARTVCFDTDDQICDCNYPQCIYSGECKIAEKLNEISDKKED